MNHLRKIGAGALLCGTLGLGGCMTLGDLGGLGGYPGGGSSYPGSGYPPPQQAYGQEFVGSVDGVDHGNARFLMRTEGAGYGAYGSRIEIHYDGNTPAWYNGQQVAASGLENGDRIRVHAAQSGGRWWAQRIEVLQDVRAGQGGYPGYGNALGGAVTFVDTRNRLIEFTSGGYSGSNSRVRYDAYTTVEYRGQRYRVEQLQRGDVIRIEGRALGNGEFLAQRILVETRVGDR